MGNTDLSCFVEHLEFLGYEHLEKQSDPLTVYFFKHPSNTRPNFMLVPFFEIDTILIRANIDIKTQVSEQRPTELFEFINSFNKENLFSCCHIENGTLFIRTTMSCEYNKQAFGARLDEFSMNIDDASNKIQVLNDYIPEEIKHSPPSASFEEPTNEYTHDQYNDSDDDDYYSPESCDCDALDYDCGDRPPCDYDGDYVDEDGNYSDNPCYHNDDYS